MKINNLLLLLEQESKVNVIRKAILDKLPMTITYDGPSGEVLSGTRKDIIPVVLGRNAKSGNYVIWAFTQKGVSKKGNLPDWRMFRVDRIKNAEIEDNAEPVNLRNIKDYVKKTPSDMKSLSDVLVYSDVLSHAFSKWKEEKGTKAGEGTRRRLRRDIKKDIDVSLKKDFEDYKDVISKEPNEKHKFDVYSGLINKIENNTVTTSDFNDAADVLFDKKVSDWSNYQKEVGKSANLGPRNEKLFKRQAKNELENLLKQDNIDISDEPTPDYDKDEKIGTDYTSDYTTPEPEQDVNTDIETPDDDEEDINVDSNMLKEIYKNFKRFIK